MEQKEENRKRDRKTTRKDTVLKGKEKIQYHTKEDLPTKEEMEENFRLDKIDKAYEEKWDQIEQQRKNNKNNKQSNRNYQREGQKLKTKGRERDGRKKFNK